MDLTTDYTLRPQTPPPREMDATISRGRRGRRLARFLSVLWAEIRRIPDYHDQAASQQRALRRARPPGLPDRKDD